MPDSVFGAAAPDCKNHLVLTSQGAAYLYDANGRRFRTNDGSVVNYVYSYTGQLLMEDRITESTWNNYIYFNGQMVAIHQQDDHFRLLFKDHLGNTRSVLKVHLPESNWQYNWTLVETADFLPYGMQYRGYLWDTPATGYMYEGKSRDGGLDYFGARHYDGSSLDTASPRWISPDPLTTRIYDPPSLNKYTYVRNDPVNLVDPDGRAPEAPLDWMPDWVDYVDISLPPHMDDFNLAFEVGGNEVVGEVDCNDSDIKMVEVSSFSKDEAPVYSFARILSELLDSDSQCLSALSNTAKNADGTIRQIDAKAILQEAVDKSAIGVGTLTVYTIRNGKKVRCRNKAVNAAVSVDGGIPEGQYASIMIATNGTWFSANTTNKSRGLTILHELGHVTYRLNSDGQSDSASQANDDYVKQNCSRLLNFLR